MADNELGIKITANADGVKEGTDKAKEHLDLAAESVSLLSDLIGIKVPEAIQKVVAGSEILGPALNAAFIPLQVLSLLQALQEVETKMSEAVRGVSQGWRDLAATVSGFHEDSEIKILQLAQKLDDLKGHHLAQLHDKLKEIDAQSLKDLGSQFDEIAKKADSLFASMELGWLKTFFLGHSGSQEAIKSLHQSFDFLMEDIKKMEKAGNFPGIGTRLDTEITTVSAKVTELRKWVNTTASTGETPYILEANSRLLQVLKDLKASYEDIAKISSSQKDIAGQGDERHGFEENRALALQAIDDDRALALKRIELRKQTAAILFQEGKESADQELADLREVNDEKYQAEKTALEKKKQLVASDKSLDPTARRSQLAALDSQLKQLDIQYQIDKQKIEQDGFNKSVQAVIEQEREKSAATKSGSQERLQIIDAAMKQLSAMGAQGTAQYKQLLQQREAAFREFTQKQEQAQEHIKQLQEEINKEGEKESRLRREIAESHVEQNGQMKIAQGLWTEEKAAQATLNQLQTDRAKAVAEMNETLAKQEAIVKRLAEETRGGTSGAPEQIEAYKKALLAFEKMKVQQLEIEKKYDAQISGLQLKLTNTFTDQLRKQMLQWQQVHQQMGQVFLSTLNSMNQNLASFITTGQANWKQLASSAIEEIIKIELQSIESQIMMTLMHAKAAADGDVIDKTTHAKEDARSAVSAAKGAWNWAANNDLLPLAPIFAAAAFAAVSAFGSAEGGQYLVPGPQLTMLHPQEMILPAGIASRMRKVIENGGGSGAGQGGGPGITVIVNHSVTAIDAQSFQGTIRQNSNMIANEIGRALRKKGIPLS